VRVKKEEEMLEIGKKKREWKMPVIQESRDMNELIK
jgi:hypothetical protein